MLLANIVINGGGAKIKRIEERLKVELTACNAVGSHINVTKVSNPMEQPWKGMK